MLSSLSIIGVCLSVILVYFNAGKNVSTIYLGAFFLLVSLYGFNQYVLLFSKSVFLNSIFTVNFGFLYYLTGPMLYWYVRSVLTDHSRFRKKDLLHLVPMLIYFVFALPYMFTPWSYKVQIAQEIVKDIGFIEEYKFTFLSEVFSIHAMYLSRPVLALVYTFWSIRLFIIYLKHRGKFLVFSRQHFMTKWLSVLLGFQFLLITSHFLLMLRPVSVFVTLNFFQVLSGLGLMGLLISPFFFPSILYGLPQLPVSMPLEKNEKEEIDPSPGEANHKFNFECDYLVTINQKVDSCMKEAQPYLHPDFNLAHISVLTNIPVHHLSFYFREEKKQHFNDYRNEWRINHAKKLIKEGKANEMTLEAIGLLSGFSTRNTFITAFKKAERISPGSFADQFPG